jgi:hypothetical protein
MAKRIHKRGIRACLIALIVVVPALGASACGSSTAARSTTSLAALADATRVPAPVIGPGVLASFSGTAAGPVGSDGGHVVWESGPLETDSSQPILRDRTLSTGTTRTIASKVDPLYGVASTARWVFFARTTVSGTQLLRASHEGAESSVVTDSLASPVASRGDVVAWAEESGSSQRVVALDAAHDVQWTVARMPSCSVSGCYHIGAVTVAENGIVFTRAAVGSQPSLVVRRAFGETGTQSVAIADDPQPDLVPSSSGALYYALSRGWYRWDFGDSRPRAVTFADDPVKSLIRHEDGRWYWLSRQGCDYRVESGGGAGGRVTFVMPGRLERLAPGAAPACTHLGGFGWTGRQAIMSWVIAWAASVGAHEDEGLRGAVVAGPRGTE